MRLHIFLINMCGISSPSARKSHKTIQLKLEYILKHFKEYYPFYYSYESEDLRYFRKDKEYIEDEIIHFVIIGIDNIIDVFTSELPELVL